MKVEISGSVLEDEFSVNHPQRCCPEKGGVSLSQSDL